MRNGQNSTSELREKGKCPLTRRSGYVNLPQQQLSDKMAPRLWIVLSYVNSLACGYKSEHHSAFSVKSRMCCYVVHTTARSFQQDKLVDLILGFFFCLQQRLYFIPWLSTWGFSGFQILQYSNFFIMRELI